MLPIVTEFLDRFPEVRVALTLLDRTVDLVDEGFDVAVRIGVLAERSAVATRIGAMRHIVVASPNLARRGTPQVPADLEAHAVVAFSGIAGVEHWLFRTATGQANIAIQPRLVVTTAEAAMDAARTGLGLTRVLSYQVAEDVARGSLLRVLPAYEGGEVPIHMVYPGGRHPRRSCARSSTSARPACAVAAPLWSERSIPDCVELFQGTLISCDRIGSKRRRLRRDHRSSQTGVRFSTNAEIPSSASSVIMFLSMISLA